MLVANSHESNSTLQHGVLLVEDDFTARVFISTALREQGYHVGEAENGSEALIQLRLNYRGDDPLPGLILLDIAMPVMDGSEFRKAQLEDPRISRIPVVTLSGIASADSDTAAMTANDALVKPVRLEVLLSTVARYCGRPPGG